MSYFFTPQRPRQPDDDDGGIFDTVMKYVGQAGKGAIIGGIAGGGVQGATAGAALGFFGVSEGGTAAGAKFYSDEQKKKPQQTSGLSPMGQLGPDSSSWIAKLSGMSALG